MVHFFIASPDNKLEEKMPILYPNLLSSGGSLSVNISSKWGASTMVVYDIAGKK